jgi:hypothetical protein
VKCNLTVAVNLICELIGRCLGVFINIGMLFLDLWLKLLVYNRNRANKGPTLKCWHFTEANKHRLMARQLFVAY